MRLGSTRGIELYMVEQTKGALPLKWLVPLEPFSGWCNREPKEPAFGRIISVVPVKKPLFLEVLRFGRALFLGPPSAKNTPAAGVLFVSGLPRCVRGPSASQ